MKIFIENICFVQNSVNGWKSGLTSAPSILEFGVVCKELKIQKEVCCNWLVSTISLIEYLKGVKLNQHLKWE